MSLSKIAKLLGSRGGKKSAEKRFKDMTPTEKSRYMQWVRRKGDKDFEKTVMILNGPIGKKATIDFLRKTGQIKD